MDQAFWIGLALAIPLSILGNMATGPAQRVLGRYNTRLRERSKKRFTRELERARWLERRPGGLATFLLGRVCMSIALFAAILPICGMALTIAVMPGPGSMGSGDTLPAILVLVSLALIYASCMWVTVMARKAWRYTALLARFGPGLEGTIDGPPPPQPTAVGGPRRP
ncbi:hypothetical protein AB0N38_04280 [Micromonospora aurantiaca]|uniref:hypothetical protein n=1 Tax=Micromonospora aurantiaca (nom. illeg.) TaxID=47850 RepID=UPI0034257DA8